MSLNDLVTSTTSSDGAGLKQVGFGTILCLVSTALFAGRTEVIEELSDVTALGFATSSPAYKMVTAAFAQNPRPNRVKLGRLALAATQTVKWIPTITTSGFVQSITLEYAGTKLTAQYTNGGSESVANIIDNMLIAVQALDAFDSHITVTDQTTYMRIVSGSGKTVYYSAWTGKYEDVTADPGIATDMAAILLEDDDWYGVAHELNAKLIQEELSDWGEAAKKLHVYTTSDWKAADSGSTDDIGDVLMGKSYAYSVSMFNKLDTGTYDHVAMMGNRFPHDPGSAGAGGTWFGKTLVGVTSYPLTPTEKTNLRAKNYNVYVVTAGRSHTLDGKCAGAEGEFVDKVRFLDWVNVRIQEAVALVKLNAEKIPYTDGGVAVLAGQVSGIMDQGVAAGGFTDSPYPVVTAALVATVPGADKTARAYRGLKWAATMAGAIHFTQVSGTVSI